MHILGTINTGAFDDLLALASIAHSENIWFHVDGAFGSLVVLDDNRRQLISGIDQADSLAFDFHKWLHCQYDAGCVLIRDVSHLESTFSMKQSYLGPSERGCSGDKPWFSGHGPEISRSFRALRVWFTLKEHGTVKLGQKIAENCQQAQYLVSLLEKHTFIRILRPVSLNIVNFRIEPDELDDTDSHLVDVFNNELVADIQLSGIAVVSSTRIREQVYIRAAIISHRSTLDDFDTFVKSLLDLCHVRLQTYSMKESEAKNETA
jgi:glutamate/tyrosine decarboxylase-like PLP-dependent enzyme